MVPIFARCFRLLAKLSATVDDGFFVDLLNQESEKLFGGYINFLKHERRDGASNYVAQKDILQHQDVAKYQHIVQRSSYVAQCAESLIFQIKSILKLVDILGYLVLTDSTTPLLLKRDLLLLELIILNNRPGKQASGKANKPNPRSEKTQTKLQALPNFSSQTHKQITEFVIGHKRVQNTEVFGEFSGIARRTLKRKLSELIKAGAIKRSTEGKKVFYGIDDSGSLAKIDAE